ncbi:MAG: hypothetical protein JW838_02770 [Spirochaetes bacterium]|nr:hypothetical protein [Spirochaetota bacterium]
MIKAVLKKQLLHDLEKLPAEMQKKVKDYVHALLIEKQEGVKGRSLLKYSGILSEEDSKRLSSVVREGCGTVDSN